MLLVFIFLRLYDNCIDKDAHGVLLTPYSSHNRKSDKSSPNLPFSPDRHSRGILARIKGCRRGVGLTIE